MKGIGRRLCSLFLSMTVCAATLGMHTAEVLANPFGISISDDGTITAEGDITIGDITIGLDGLEITPEDILNGIDYLMSEFKTGDSFAVPSPERGQEMALDMLEELQELLEQGGLHITLPDFDDIEDPMPETEYDDEVLDTSTSLVRNNAPTSYYYSVLNAEEQQMYQDMLTLAKFPDNTDLRISRESALNPDEDAFYEEYCRAYFALNYDHAELFWLYTDKLEMTYYYSSTPNENGLYDYFFTLTGDYSNYRSEMTAFNLAVDKCLASLDRSQSQAKVALQIHDYIIDLATYDYAALENPRIDNSQTAYGILVQSDDGVANSAVCAGYANTYTYLLQQVGIDSMIILGMAGASEKDAGRHAWNLVNLDGQWYECDVTWDDFEVEPDPSNSYYSVEVEALGDAAYVERQKHYLFNITTDEIQNYTPDDSMYYYSANGGWVCYTGDSVHYRHNDQTSYGYGDELSRSAPVANGTYYTYDFLMANG